MGPQVMKMEMKDLSDSAKTFGKLVSMLEVYLNDWESVDNATRLAELEQMKVEVSNKVLAHNILIADKFEAMKNAKDAAKKYDEKGEKTRVSNLIKAEKRD